MGVHPREAGEGAGTHATHVTAPISNFFSGRFFPLTERLQKASNLISNALNE